MAAFPVPRSSNDWSHGWLGTYTAVSAFVVTLRWAVAVTGDGGPQSLVAQSVWLLALLPVAFAFGFALETALRRLEASDDGWRLYAFVSATLVGYAALWSDLLAHLFW
jgi:hypothetical protein